MLLSSAPKPEQGCLQGAEPQGKGCRAWGGEGQVSEGSWSTSGRSQPSEQRERTKEISSRCSCFPSPSCLSHLEADRGAALTGALEGRPREEGRAAAEVQWCERMRKGCSGHQQTPRLGRRLKMRGVRFDRERSPGVCVTPRVPFFSPWSQLRIRD